MVLSTISGGKQGTFVILDAESGAILKRGYAIPPADQDKGFSGGSLWTTSGIDTQTGFAYLEPANSPAPSVGSSGHPNTDAILKVDVDPTRPTFGEVVGSFRGLDNMIPSTETDLFKFGGAPNIFNDSHGRKLEGAFQKSGLYYVVDASTMQQVWRSVVGVAFPLGASSTAYDGATIYGATAAPGHVYALEGNSGSIRWIAPTADAAHVAFPVAYANGVIYTTDAKGFLDAYDASTGTPLLHRPMMLGANTGTDPVVSLGTGAIVARNTVYAAVGSSVGTPGFVIAFRPDPIDP
jgi:outer membrane protein assembly factor BamB